jgi:fluoride ion exporter CrcB/FEX
MLIAIVGAGAVGAASRYGSDQLLPTNSPKSFVFGFFLKN